MSNDIQKADQIAYRLFTKLALVVNQARSTADPVVGGQVKLDKWFNLETPDSDIFRDHLRIYRTVSTAATPHPPTAPPPFELQVLLTIPELTSNQVLVYQAQDSSRVRVEPTPRAILLESWALAFTPTHALPSSSSSSSASSSSPSSPSYASYDSDTGGGGGSEQVAPSTMYKHGIPLFRSLFSLLRVLPAWKLFKRLRRRGAPGMGPNRNRNGNLGIRLQVRGVDGDDPIAAAASFRGPAASILAFDARPSPVHPHPLPTHTHVFPSVPHPLGSLCLTTRYLATPNFQLDELESLLSDRFLSLDDGLGEGMGVMFTPTLLKGRGREGGGASPLGSLPIKTSLPVSPPPTATSIAERFILPPPTTTTTTVTTTSTTTRPALHTRTTSLPPPLQLPSQQQQQQRQQQPYQHQQPQSASPSPSYKSTSNPNSPRGGNVPLPAPGLARAATTTGPGTGSGSGSGISVASASSRGPDVGNGGWLRDDGASGAGNGGSGSGSGTGSGKQGQVSGIAARLRKESTGAGRGADLPSAPGPLPIRRPSINPVHPFKASTLSSGSPSLHSPSPSLRQPSPLSSAGPVPSATLSPTTRVPPSPIGMGMGGRPSPPFAPSSLGDRRSLASAEGAGDESPSPQMQGLGLGTGTGTGTGKKRYSSSFTKRYSASAAGGGGAAGSEGSTGSGERNMGGERVASGGSFLSNNTDDDDISVFVQEIDARKPLSGHQRLRSRDRDTMNTGGRRPSVGGGRSGSRSRGGGDEKPIAGLLSTDEHHASSSSTWPMLTSESEVDERLRQMNQVFLESLEGLGGRRRERRSPSRFEGDDGGSERSSEPDPPLGRMSTEGSGSGSRESAGGVLGRGRGFMLPPPPHHRRPRLDSRNTSTSDVGAAVQGSDEVIGRLSLDGERRESRGQ